ncbi:membrane protein insertase YidC [Geomonas anaerohicana]|uniref:Membrane protein insertase YidC n=1 Tax=Geomonas anaerohicana TaxID=2798583 RepID=A0ABS0Y8I0_9BACT|nr:membrane protein insertase YidC [Geomonas anaerohicana]MBJ6748617.1 membrane protein insertase YidC [Geomonas anaerohicana]
MEKRTIVAILLSIGVMYAYSFIFPPAKQVPPAGSAKQGAVSSATVASAPQATPAATAGAPNAPIAVPAAPAGAARDITVDTDLYSAVFSTQGAGLKKFVLKKYKDVAGPKGQDIVLVNETAANRFNLLSDSRELGLNPTALYNVSGSDLKLTGANKGTLEFTTTTPQGIVFKKTFTFSGDAYRIGLTEQVQNGGSAQVAAPVHLLQTSRVIDQKAGGGRYEVYGPSTLTDNAVKSEKLDSLLKAPVQFDKNILWSAFADKYFMESVIAEKGSIAQVRLSRPSVDANLRDIASPTITVAPGQSAAVSYALYYGPKDLDILKAQGSRLEEVIDYGWFAAIAKPLVVFLKFLYKYTGNYGIAIIIITCILKLVFFPLTHKSYKSMKDMQKLQPKMNELKEKYKNDRDAMNRAVMELYKTHKVNPLGGCLPMIVQIPVFFGLYRSLMYSIELRHAPFYLWITDLSAKDPYYVTPLIMGATMFIQQKMTPTNMDPVQAKMMLMLPVVFTFMFLNFPSGLVIYWLVNNVLTIAQQMYINKSVAD